eukprot:365734-Chlamydomonas_euryale.AAC.3
MRTSCPTSMGCLGIGPSTSGCRSVMKVATMPRSGVPGMIRLMMNANGMRPWRMDGRYRATCCTGRGIVTTSIAPNVNAARPAGICGAVAAAAQVPSQAAGGPVACTLRQG